MAAESRDWWRHYFFFCGRFYPKMTLKNFHTDRMWHSTFAIMTTKRGHRWCHKRNRTHSLWGVLDMCQVFQIFPCCGFRDTEVQLFSVFPTWLAHHVTHDGIIMIKTFCMSSHTDVENFVSIRQAVAEKNTKVLCGQTNKQTDPNAIPSLSARVKMLNTKIIPDVEPNEFPDTPDNKL